IGLSTRFKGRTLALLRSTFPPVVRLWFMELLKATVCSRTLSFLKAEKPLYSPHTCSLFTPKAENPLYNQHTNALSSPKAENPLYSPLTRDIYCMLEGEPLVPPKKLILSILLRRPSCGRPLAKELSWCWEGDKAGSDRLLNLCSFDYIFYRIEHKIQRAKLA